MRCLVAEDEPSSITQALPGKCNAYLMKPIDLRVLKSELDELKLVAGSAA